MSDTPFDDHARLAKIAKAETTAFMRRVDAVDAILAGAKPSDIMLLAAHAFAGSGEALRSPWLPRRSAFDRFR